jgi:asparagine synthase (glutamine-hydrolysing)
MCSILGAACNYESDIGNDLISKINHTLHHRGPDGNGIKHSRNVVFAHNRLSIIGPKEEYSEQPLKTNGKMLTFNGEIYNYKHVSSLLRNDGISCGEKSDTEVLFKSLMHWGLEKTLKLIDGMFAFAYLDPNKGLFLVRDRLGEKPLYWSFDGKKLWFASEIKAVISSGSLSASPNLSKINEFFYTGKIYGEETFFKDIFEVQPGQYIKIKIDLSNIKKKTYWKLENFQTKSHPNSYSSLKRGFLNKLNVAIDTRSVSDVPIGVLLSGGVDSNTILNSLLSSGKKDVELFFADNKSKESSELKNVALCVDFFKDKFPEKNIILNRDILSTDNYLEKLQEFTWHNDEPTQFPISPQLMNLTSVAAKKNIKVLLSGEGADEILFGYDRFLRTKDIISNSKDKEFIARHLYFGGGIENVKIINELTSLDDYKKYESWQWIDKNCFNWSNDTLQMIYSQKFRLQSLLQRQDRVGMSNGVEIRVPFLMPEFVGWCNSISSDYKTIKGETKKILKDSMQGHLPKSILRGKKMGSPSFISSWLESQDSYSFMMRVVGNKNGFSQSFLNGRKALQIIHEHYLGSKSYSYIVWLLLVLEVWHNVFVEPNYEFIQ